MSECRNMILQREEKKSDRRRRRAKRTKLLRNCRSRLLEVPDRRGKTYQFELHINYYFQTNWRNQPAEKFPSILLSLPPPDPTRQTFYRDSSAICLFDYSQSACCAHIEKLSASLINSANFPFCTIGPCLHSMRDEKWSLRWKISCFTHSDELNLHKIARESLFAPSSSTQIFIMMQLAIKYREASE
jgi:hypothetical protein